MTEIQLYKNKKIYGVNFFSLKRKNMKQTSNNFTIIKSITINLVYIIYITHD